MSYYNNQFARDIEGQARNAYVAGMDWQDIAQVLDLALWRGMKRFKEGHGAGERTYAMAIMRNCIKDLIKHASRQKRYLDSRHLVFSELEETPAGQALLDMARPIFEI